MDLNVTIFKNIYHLKYQRQWLVRLNYFHVQKMLWVSRMKT